MSCIDPRKGTGHEALRITGLLNDLAEPFGARDTFQNQKWLAASTGESNVARLVKVSHRLGLDRRTDDLRKGNRFELPVTD